MAKTRTQIVAQITKLEDRLAQLRIDLETAADDGYSPNVGDLVSFEYGRGETKRPLQGKVLGVNDTGKGVYVTVFVEDGANSEVCKVFASHCRLVGGEQEPAEVVAAAE